MYQTAILATIQQAAEAGIEAGGDFDVEELAAIVRTFLTGPDAEAAARDLAAFIAAALTAGVIPP